MKKIFGETLSFNSIAISHEKGVRNQRKQLLKLLEKAQATSFGRDHSFAMMLYSADHYTAFRSSVPLADYDALFDRYWHRALADEAHVTWPGYIPYFALSSGTSGAASKYVPLTHEMIHIIRKVSQQMFLDLRKFNLGAKQFTRQMLMVGSCTAPAQQGLHQYGDLSGILGLNRPMWLDRYYRPGRHITDLPEWGQRIEAIGEEAPKWDIGFVVGNPMWVQLIFEHILERHGLKHIHEIWPNLRLFTHGGVFFEPYRKGIEGLLGQEIHYLDSYMASEGFIGLQSGPERLGLHLLTKAGIFYEFLPFTEKNFDENGNMTRTAQAVPLWEVENGVEYAIILSTVSGAWRYLLGDTIRFTDKEHLLFKITGRTKLGLSVCGEHVSVDNLNMAVIAANEKLRAGIREFTVAGLRHGSKWMHRWWASYENSSISPEALMEFLDGELCRLNDDYAVERKYALDKVELWKLPNNLFHQWLTEKGKFNGQAKIPRVMKGESLRLWEGFLADKASL